MKNKAVEFRPKNSRVWMSEKRDLSGIPWIARETVIGLVKCMVITVLNKKVHIKWIHFSNFLKGNWRKKKYSQSQLLNDHLPKTTTCLQRPLFWGPNFNFHNIKLPLINEHLSREAKKFGSQGWSINTSLTVSQILKKNFFKKLRTGLDLICKTVRPGSISSTFYTKIFLYKSALHSFSLVTFWLCIFLAQKYWRKSWA